MICEIQPEATPIAAALRHADLNRPTQARVQEIDSKRQLSVLAMVDYSEAVRSFVRRWKFRFDLFFEAANFLDRGLMADPPIESVYCCATDNNSFWLLFCKYLQLVSSRMMDSPCPG